MIYESCTLTEHLHSTEFACPCCKQIKIEQDFANKLEILTKELNANLILISSGYRCYNEEMKVAGFVAKHNEGIACDCCFVYPDGNYIESKYVICKAFDLELFNGIAKIDNFYVHLDNRKYGIYHGDESVGNGNYWENPYTYFRVPHPTPEGFIKYTVCIDDTLSSIAQRYNTTYLELAKINNIENPDLIFPGQILLIPLSCEKTQNTYTVCEGDCLTSIGEKLGKNWERIYNDNKDIIGLNPDLIIPGQVLKIYND